MRQDLTTLQQDVARVIEGMGYELVGVEYHPRHACSLLRVYIDHIDSERHITLDDCERVSHQLSGFLDVANPITGHYNLEISSPGLDRPLFEHKHFVRFTGAKVRVQLRELVEGRRKLVGLLQGAIDEHTILIEADGQTWRVPLEKIEKARLVSEQ